MYDQLASFRLRQTGSDGGEEETEDASLAAAEEVSLDAAVGRVLSEPDGVFHTKKRLFLYSNRLWDVFSLVQRGEDRNGFFIKRLRTFLRSKDTLACPHFLRVKA